MAHRVTLIPGDGIGPEVTAAAVRLLEATGVKFEWESYAAGAAAFERKNHRADEAKDRKIAALEEKLTKKNEVIAELMEENVRSKKANGEL